MEKIGNEKLCQCSEKFLKNLRDIGPETDLKDRAQYKINFQGINTSMHGVESVGDSDEENIGNFVFNFGHENVSSLCESDVEKFVKGISEKEFKKISSCMNQRNNTKILFERKDDNHAKLQENMIIIKSVKDMEVVLLDCAKQVFN